MKKNGNNTVLISASQKLEFLAVAQCLQASSPRDLEIQCDTEVLVEGPLRTRVK